MKDFNFISPTKIYFGKNKEKDIGKIIKNIESEENVNSEEVSSVVSSVMVWVSKGNVSGSSEIVLSRTNPISTHTITIIPAKIISIKLTNLLLFSCFIRVSSS